MNAVNTFVACYVLISQAPVMFSNYRRLIILSPGFTDLIDNDETAKNAFCGRQNKHVCQVIALVSINTIC